jgi:hypothetical protein
MLLGRVMQRHRKSLGFVEYLVVLEAVVELAEELIEQVAGGGCVTVTVFSCQRSSNSPGMRGCPSRNSPPSVT